MLSNNNILVINKNELIIEVLYNVAAISQNTATIFYFNRNIATILLQYCNVL